MSSDTFKFLKLPLLVKRQVLKGSQLRDLFLFSQLSQKSYDLVRNSVIKVLCGLDLYEKSVQIKMGTISNPLVFVFGTGFFKLDGSLVSGLSIFNEEEFEYQYDTVWPQYFDTRKHDDTDAINTIFRHFSGLFHFSSLSTIYLNPDFLEYFESVELFEDYMFRIGNPKTELLCIQGTPLTGSELIRIIDNVNCTHMTMIDVPFRGRLNYHKINTLNTIYLLNGQVKESDFLNLKVKEIFLGSIRFTENILVKFVRKWLRKESKTELLIMKLHESKAWKSEEEVFGWVGATKWNPRTRGRYYRWKAPRCCKIGGTSGRIQEWDCSEGRDILRSDGLLATIYMTEDTFNFFVWNKRFH